MGDRALAHLADDPADSCPTSDCRRCGSIAPCWADCQPAGQGLGRPRKPCHLIRHVALRSFPAAGVVPYAIAQLLGSVLGVIAARGVWGQVVAEPPVVYAVLQPGPEWSTWGLFATEALGMAVIVFLVGICLAVPRLAPFVPWVVGALVGMGIAVLGTATGGSLNPARQFGPATVSGQTQFLWVYLLAPVLGAEIAAWLRQAIQNRRAVLTHRLCGTLGYPNTKAAGHQI